MADAQVEELLYQTLASDGQSSSTVDWLVCMCSSKTLDNSSLVQVQSWLGAMERLARATSHDATMSSTPLAATAVVATFSGNDGEHKRRRLMALAAQYHEPKARGTVVGVVRQSLATALVWLDVVELQVASQQQTV